MRLSALAFLSLTVLAVACDTATQDRLERPRDDVWNPVVVYAAGGDQESGVAATGLVELGDGTLVVGDGEVGRLLRKAPSEARFRPLSSRTFRPIVPAVLHTYSDSILLSSNWMWFQATNIVDGTSYDLRPPLSAWGTRRAGEFLLSPSFEFLVVAPATSGPTMTVLADSDTATASLTLARMSDLDDATYFGPRIVGLGLHRTASLEGRVSLAGWAGDSLVVVRLFNGDVSVYPPELRSGTQPARTFQLPRTFLPQQTSAVDGYNVVQPQLAGATVLANGTLAVLRHIDYRWRDVRPWRRVLGNWVPKHAVELYSLDGDRLGGRSLPEGFWRGPVRSFAGDQFFVFGPIGSDDPRFVAIWRFDPAALTVQKP